MEAVGFFQIMNVNSGINEEPKYKIIPSELNPKEGEIYTSNITGLAVVVIANKEEIIFSEELDHDVVVNCPSERIFSLDYVFEVEQGNTILEILNEYGDVNNIREILLSILKTYTESTEVQYTDEKPVNHILEVSPVELINPTKVNNISEIDMYLRDILVNLEELGTFFEWVDPEYLLRYNTSVKYFCRNADFTVVDNNFYKQVIHKYGVDLIPEEKKKKLIEDDPSFSMLFV